MSILPIHAHRGNPWAYSWPALNTNGFFRVNKEILIMFKSWGFFLVKKFINCTCSLRSVFCLLVYTKIMDGVEGSDGRLKQWISFNIHLWGTRAGFATENIIVVAGMNELNHLFVLFYLPVLVLTNTTTHPSVRGYWWIFTHNTPFHLVNSC